MRDGLGVLLVAVGLSDSVLTRDKLGLVVAFAGVTLLAYGVIRPGGQDEIPSSEQDELMFVSSGGVSRKLFELSPLTARLTLTVRRDDPRHSWKVLPIESGEFVSTLEGRGCDECVAHLDAMRSGELGELLPGDLAGRCLDRRRSHACEEGPDRGPLAFARSGANLGATHWRVLHRDPGSAPGSEPADRCGVTAKHLR